MILLQQDLEALEEHWAVASIPPEQRKRAYEVAQARLVQGALRDQLHLDFKNLGSDDEFLERLAAAYEVAAAEGLDALLHASRERTGQIRQTQAGSFRAFEIRRALAIPHESLERVLFILQLGSLAYVGDRWADLRRWLFEHTKESEVPNVASLPWDQRVLFRIYDGWLRLFRKDSWNDLHGVADVIAGLRAEQSQYEAALLKEKTAAETQSLALRLVALYHWARATEQLSKYMLQGEPARISQELDLHFEKAVGAALVSADMAMEMLLRWLHVAARQMVAGSVWTATAGINSNVTRFVRSITSSSRPMIELLPPQRSALAEQGLLDPASRAVVVDLPTSGGKTTLAQFRILQALNQFAQDKGWVAYVAPTRALVAQLLRRLRRDFSPLGIHVEQVSGGVEIDSFEEDLFRQQDGFHVLLATPEKLSLIVRNGKLNHRPLALVVVDEAHNIEDTERGLRLELLLATIRQDCPNANYLLLMPFVPHSEMLARWLDPGSGKPISLGTTAWQPNERIVGLFKLEELDERGPRGKKRWRLVFETATTTPRTIHLHGTHAVGVPCPLDIPISQARSLMKMTTAMAKVFSKRGTSIAVGDTIAHVWDMARTAAASMEAPGCLSDEVRLVQSFLRDEVGEGFELVTLLQKQVAVHHRGLPDEARSLIEWLAEEGHLRVLCATTTIAQGINFPVSSVFLSRAEHPSQRGPIRMTAREFWNLAGRAGRVGQDSVGIVGLATDGDAKTATLRQFIGEATADLASRLITLLNQIVGRPLSEQLLVVIQDPQWADFRSFVAHLLKEAKDLHSLQGQTEQLLRSTFGYATLRSQNDPGSQAKAATLLAITNAYAERIARNMGMLKFADSTGFDPEGVNMAMNGLRGMEDRLTSSDWQPQSLFGSGKSLSQLIGVMMQLPALHQELATIAGSGFDRQRVAEIAKAWVAGQSINEIAKAYFQGTDLTDQISEACRGIYRALVNNSVWGLAALSKLPGSGINWEALPEEDKRRLNMLPAFLYHGVNTEDAVLMRMNQVPRSLARRLGDMMRAAAGHSRALNTAEAREFIRGLSTGGWENARPPRSQLRGEEYRAIWQQLSGERA